MAGRSHLSIGEVLSLLQDEFPDVTISKIRFLESQGLVDPERTPSGYRKFYEGDIERLRWVLRQQRDAFLPLKVIKGRLDESAEAYPNEAGIAPGEAGEPVPADGHGPLGRRSPADAPQGAGRGGRDEVGVPARGVISPGRGRNPLRGPGPAQLFDAAPLSRSFTIPDNADPDTGRSAERSGQQERVGLEGQTAPVAVVPAVAEASPAPGATAAPAPGAPTLAAAGAAATTATGAPRGGEGGWLAPVAPARAATAAPTGTAPTATGAPSAIGDAAATAVATTPGPSGAAVAGTPAPAVPVLTTKLQPEPSAATDVVASGSPAVPIAPVTRISGAAAPPAEVAGTGAVLEAGTSPAVSPVRDSRPGAPPAPREPAAAPRPRGSEAPAGPVAARRPPGVAGRRGDVGRFPGGRLDRALEVGPVPAEDDLALEELLNEADVGLETVRDLERFGLVTPRVIGGIPYYSHDAAVIARLASAFARHGVEARHLRAYKGAAEREAGLVQQVIMPLIRQRNPEARLAAAHAVEELSSLGGELRAALLRSALSDLH